MVISQAGNAVLGFIVSVFRPERKNRVSWREGSDFLGLELIQGGEIEVPDTDFVIFVGGE